MFNISDETKDYIQQVIAFEKHFNLVDSYRTVNTANKLPTSKINYIAILTLEKLGIPAPSQIQIDIVESLINLAKRNFDDVNRKGLFN